MTEYSDGELLEQFRNGDNPNYAFNLLVRKYQQKVYYHVRRIIIDHDDTNDVVQNTFIKAWKGLSNFREDAQLFTWLYRIATNEALTFLKKKRTAFFLPIVNVERHLSEKVESDPAMSGDAIELKLQKAILTLPEKQRIVFNLRYYDEMKYEEMSEVLGTSVGALKASYHIAAQKIEKYMIGN
ncbi:MAG: ECF RNA polymerase sigma-E factor [Bacteroidetes bacterium ADurb.Bin397]|jgi:RNA polymerase sigma factor (sigma-70 family)|nr:sigma-70 family RNA polymerase sigma factor [Bacteroidia bacterium]OQA04933.1 MAG: ECF RNA polymerase sigma-E factor [Bacteroidetes bacterium ADurb.Bin397]